MQFFLTVNYQYPDFKLLMHSFLVNVNSKLVTLNEHKSQNGYFQKIFQNQIGQLLTYQLYISLWIMSEEFLSSFKESLSTGYINKEIASQLLYQPKLLINNIEPPKKIITSLLYEFQTCESFFYFSCMCHDQWSSNHNKYT